jgi:inorganic triphosphatase YgiF
MAKKKPARSKMQTSQVLARLQSNMKNLQRDAEALLSRTRKKAEQLISRDQKRAVERLLDQAKRLRVDFEKRARQASKQVESRAQRLVTTAEKEASKRLEPLLKRLDLPTRAELQGLSRRIAQLEKRARAPRQAPNVPAAPAPTAENPNPTGSSFSAV